MHPPRWPAAVATAAALALAPACIPDHDPGTAVPGPPPQRPARPPGIDTADAVVPPGAIGLGRGWQWDTETVEFDSDFLDPLIGPSPCPAERRAAPFAGRATVEVEYAYARVGGVIVAFRGEPGRAAPHLPTAVALAARAAG